jgi:hypothetical protein
MPTKLKIVLENNRKLAQETSHPGNQKAIVEFTSPVIDTESKHIKEKRFT